MKKNQDSVAIVGIGCRFPGRANSPEALWSMLMDRTDAITEIPKDRWNIEKYYHPDMRAEGRSYSKWGGFVENIDRFDPEAFAISPREAEFMDPQQRLLLEVAWEAMEDGGYRVEGLSGSDTGVFLGLCTNDYSQIQTDQNETGSVDPHSATGSAISIAANRLSYCFNFHGPSLVVDTACSSSLVATHLACASLLDGECGLALAGGANVILLPVPFISFCAATMLSPDGRCKAFDARADGFVRGEGAAVVVLKRLSDALADGNPVYALINGSGVNSDGRTNGISLPSKEAQAALIDQIYRQAGIATNDIFYVEAHGTGTAVGDPIEAAVLGEKFGVARANDDCIIGSVKTNIGHLEAGAGIAGLIKAALCLKHRMVPPSLHFETPNPNIPFEELHLRVPVEPVVYPDDADKAMTVGVNSFGFGGTNAHAVLSEFRPVLPEATSVPRSESGRLYLLPLSARSLEGLKILAQSYIDYLAAHPDLHIADVVYSAALKTHYPFRMTIAAANVTDAVQQLNAFVADESSLALVNGHIARDAVFKTAFVFSGQGPQWWAMGRQLLQAEPVFKAMVLRCDQLMSQYSDWSLYEELTAPESASRIAETEISQPLLFALQVALAEVWKARGVTPDAVVGHSVGEVAAAYVSGALDLAAAVKVVFYRGLTMSHASGEGGMLAAGLTRQQAEDLIEPLGAAVTLAALNSPSSVTLSGQPEQLKLLAEQLERQGVFNRRLDVRFAFHSAQMDPVKDELLNALTAIQLAEIKLPVYSTVTGKRVTENCFDANYWWRNVREKVSFSPAIGALLDDGYDTFIEIGPHPVLRASILEAAQAEKPHVLPSLRRMQDEPLTLLGSLGSLYCLGYPLNWRLVNPVVNGALVRLPGYPWQKQRYWHESQQWLERRTGGPAHPLLMARDRFADMSWSSIIDPVIYPYLADHKVRDNIVFPAAAYIEMCIAAAHQCFPNDAFVLEDIQIRKALYLNSDQHSPWLQFSIDANDHAFTIRSGLPSGDSPWTTHCQGYLRKIGKPAKTVDVNAYQQTCKYFLAADDIYRYFNEYGLQFGPAFRGLAGVYAGTEHALGDVRLQPENAAQADRYFFHPAQLDACFQSLIGAVGKDLKRVYLPVAIDQLRFHGKAEAKMWACVDLIHLNEYSISGNVRVCSVNGDLLLEILGYRSQYVDMASQESRIDEQFYRYQWIPRPLPMVEENSVRQATFFPEFTQVAERMRQEAISVSERFGGIERMLEMANALDRLGLAYIVQGLAELGCPTQPGASLTVEALLNEHQVKPHYRLLLRRLFNILETYAYVELQTPEAAIIKQPLSVTGLRSSWA
ncbi:MAG: beta-ketoacyl synthase N-terminal-like domain-containing protein, partial [Methylococcales bacterium]